MFFMISKVSSKIGLIAEFVLSDHFEGRFRWAFWASAVCGAWERSRHFALKFSIIALTPAHAEFIAITCSTIRLHWRKKVSRNMTIVCVR